MENENQGIQNQEPQITNAEPEIMTSVPQQEPVVTQEPEVLDPNQTSGVEGNQPTQQSSEPVVVSPPQPQVINTPQVQSPPPTPTSFPAGEEKKKGGGIKKLIILILVLVVLGGLGYFIYNKFINNKNVIRTEVETVFKSLKTTLKTIDQNVIDFDFEKDSIGLTGNLVIESNYKDESMDLTKLNNYQISYGGVFNKSGNQASLNLGINGSSSKIVDIKGYVEGKTLKLSLGDIYNKVLTTDLEKEIKDLDLTKSAEVDSYIKLLEKTESFINNYIKEEDIVKTTEGNQKKVSYTLNKNDFMIKLLTNFEEDEEVMSILSSLSNESEKGLKGNMDATIQDLKETESTDTLTTNVYLEGTTAKKVEIISNTTDFFDEKVENKITINIDGKVYKYSATEDGEELFHGEYNKDTKTFTYEIEDDYSTTKITITMKDNKYSASFNYKDNDLNNSVSITIDGETKVSGNKETSNMTMKFEITEDGEPINFTLKNTLEAEKNAKVEKVEGNAVSIEELTDTELNTIYENLLNKINPILKDIIPEETVNTYFRQIVEE